MLENSATKPAGTTMLSRVPPMWYDIGRWRIAVSGPFLTKDRSGDSTTLGDGGGASGRTTSSSAGRVVTCFAVSTFITVVVSLRAGTTPSARVGSTPSGRAGTTAAGAFGATVAGRFGTTAAVGARAAVSDRALAVAAVPLSTATSAAAM